MQYLFDERGRRYLDVSERASQLSQGSSCPYPVWHHRQLSSAAARQQGVSLAHQRACGSVALNLAFPLHLAGLCWDCDCQRGPLSSRSHPGSQGAVRLATAHDHYLPQQSDCRVCQGTHRQNARQPQGIAFKLPYTHIHMHTAHGGTHVHRATPTHAHALLHIIQWEYVSMIVCALARVCVCVSYRLCTLSTQAVKQTTWP